MRGRNSAKFYISMEMEFGRFGWPFLPIEYKLFIFLVGKFFKFRLFFICFEFHVNSVKEVGGRGQNFVLSTFFCYFNFI